MKTTCVLFVIGTIAAMAGYYFLIRHYVPEAETTPTALLSVFGGISALLLVGAISNVVQGISDRRVIADAVKNAPMRDNKRAAAIGYVHPSGLSTINAPFTGRECLAYEYEVYEMTASADDQSSTKHLHCSGYGMTPCAIRTTTSDVRLLGFPLLDQMPKDFMENEIDRTKANEYLAQTQFLPLHKNVTKIFSEFEDLFQDADGSLRKDFGDAVTVEPKHFLTEIIVPVNAPVCAIGVYSRAKNALFAKSAAFPIRLVPGNAAEAEKTLRKSGLFQIVFALIACIFVNGIVGVFLYSKQNEIYKIPESQQYSVISRAAEAHDFDQLARMFKHGVNPNATDDHSRTLLQTTSDDEVARQLLKLGADPNVPDPETLETPIFEAARSGNVKRLKILLEGRAAVNAVCAIPWKHTAIDEALRYGKSESVDVLLAAGAKDPRVSATNGRAISSDSPEIAICRQYLRAIQAQDKSTLKSLTTARYEYFFDDIDLNAWKARYPLSIAEFEGYTNEEAATISFRGSSSAGQESQWIYQLLKENEGWKIHQTWPLTVGQELTWR